MLSHDREHWQRTEHQPAAGPLMLALSTLDRTLLTLVGGKAANLGELIRAGFAVPPGFCVTTAAYTLVSAGAGFDPLLRELATHQRDDPVRQAELAAAVRAAVLQAPIPSEVIAAIADAYQALGQGEPVPVAVRSSATAEDLPTASFAGQQETYVPLVLLSDGTEPSAAPCASAIAQAMLQGTPASPGIVTARAQVILDPHGARLAPGEILVAPTTDPGWTPLFLSAGGLVMEMGGAMAHGAIVAREYGIPAVVGVAGATERITTGNRITVDGTAGTIVIEHSSDK